jgi:hypothetical protein
VHTALDALGIAVGCLLFLLLVASVFLVVRGRPPQPPRSKGQAARVRGTWRRSWSYQSYILAEIRRGARGRRRS